MPTVIVAHPELKRTHTPQAIHWLPEQGKYPFGLFSPLSSTEFYWVVSGLRLHPKPIELLTMTGQNILCSECQTKSSISCITPPSILHPSFVTHFPSVEYNFLYVIIFWVVAGSWSGDCRLAGGSPSGLAADVKRFSSHLVWCWAAMVSRIEISDLLIKKPQMVRVKQRQTIHIVNTVLSSCLFIP